MAQRFNADDSDHSGSTRACACGRTARYAGRRPKTFITLLGPLTLERAYFHCDACRTGVCPRDQTLGMQATSLSPATTRMVGLTAAEVSFAKTSELLAVLAGVEVETRQVERTAEALSSSATWRSSRQSRSRFWGCRRPAPVPRAEIGAASPSRSGGVHQHPKGIIAINSRTGVARMSSLRESADCGFCCADQRVDRFNELIIFSLHLRHGP